MDNKHGWHVVSNADGTILAVYGSALLSDAQETARRIEHTTGCATYLHFVLCERPHVGGSISMRNAKKGL